MNEERRVAFGFSKKVDKRALVDSIIRDEASKDESKDTDYVLSLSGKKINSTLAGKEEKKSDLVIPLIVKNNWRLPKTTVGSKVKSVGDQDDLESRAVREILEETRRNAEGEEEDEERVSTLVIPMYMQNKVPEGYETDAKLDVALRAEEPTSDDYDNVPIEDFGLAMLRGMGWKPDVGIGSTNKRVVKPCEVVLRPKGLGLGANPRLKMNQNNHRKGAEKESKALVVGAYVRLLSGANKGLYGEVQSLDMDNARVVVKLTLSSENVTISELYVEVVSKSEYKKESKLINKDKYEEYKAKDELRQKQELDEENKRRSESRKHERREISPVKESKSRHHKREYSPDHKKHSTSSKKQKKSFWVRPLLRVRFIDKKFKNGQYFNSKIIIDDVVNEDICVCRTENGRILEDIPQKSLETLIPKTSPAIVMIVQGSNKGQLGEILDKNKKKCVATVQLLQEKSLVELDYDSICEYAGKISEDYY